MRENESFDGRGIVRPEAFAPAERESKQLDFKEIRDKEILLNSLVEAFKNITPEEVDQIIEKSESMNSTGLAQTLEALNRLAASAKRHLDKYPEPPKY